MRRSNMLVIAALCATWLACGDDDDGGADTTTDSAGDTAETSEVTPETVEETSPETVDDTTADTAAETTPDTADDTTADTDEETTPDTVEDTTAETSPDTVADTVEDLDTGPDGIEPGVTLRAYLSGSQEVPPVATGATGTALVEIHDDRNGFDVTLEVDLQGAVPLPMFTAAHIHLGAVGVNGPVLFGLASGAFTSPLTVTLTAADLQGEGTFEAALEAIEAGHTYVNVHSNLHPAGVLRGQVGRVQLRGTLSGLQEPDPVMIDASGAVVALLDETQERLAISIVASGIEGATAAHLHLGAPGLNGPVYLPLETPVGGTSTTVFDAADATDPSWSDIIAKVVGGELYVNVHTAEHPGGAVRAHLGKAVLRARMSGGQEVPRVETDAFGTAELLIDGLQTGGRMTVTLTGVDGATAMHLHGGAVGDNGSVWLPLSAGAPGESTVVDLDLSAIDAVAPEIAVPAILAGHTYVNVHTAADPAGHIRGQLGPARLRALLSGAQEVPAVDSAARGRGKVYVDGAQGVVRFELDAGDLAEITAAHVHTGLPGESGGVLVGLASASFTSPLTVTTVVSELDPSVAVDLVDKLLGGSTYFNVHTVSNPGGELRGQIGVIQLAAVLDGLSEVPPNDSTRTGTGMVVINGALEEVRATLSLSDYADTTAAHIHGAPPGENGGVLFGLASAGFTSPLSRTFGPGDVTGGTLEAYEAAVDAIISGLTYFNVHTGAFPGGEVRGQIGAR